MGQSQDEIPLLLADGSRGSAVRTGNNAAWLCTCDRKLPLLGYSDLAGSTSSASIVACPNCGRQFRVVSSKQRGTAERVEELKGTV